MFTFSFGGEESFHSWMGLFRPPRSAPELACDAGAWYLPSLGQNLMNQWPSSGPLLRRAELILKGRTR